MYKKTTVAIGSLIVLATSCNNYKAKLFVNVTDSSNKTIERAYVALLTEDKAREFEKGVDKQPDAYLLDSTSSAGKARLKIKADEPIYGLVAKEGYYTIQFYIENPLDNKSKNEITIKLGELDNNYYLVNGKSTWTKPVNK